MRLIKDKSDWVIMIVALCILQVMSFWCIDISVSGMMNKGQVTNGWLNIPPVLSYHIGLYLAIISLLVFAFISIHHILKEKK